MKKTIGLLVILSGVLYLVWEWWQGSERTCNCSNNGNVVGTGSSSLALNVLAAKIDELENNNYINQLDSNYNQLNLL